MNIRKLICPQKCWSKLNLFDSCKKKWHCTLVLTKKQHALEPHHGFHIMPCLLEVLPRCHPLLEWERVWQGQSPVVSCIYKNSLKFLALNSKSVHPPIEVPKIGQHCVQMFGHTYCLILHDYVQTLNQSNVWSGLCDESCPCFRKHYTHVQCWMHSLVCDQLHKLQICVHLMQPP